MHLVDDIKKNNQTLWLKTIHKKVFIFSIIINYHYLFK